MHVIGVNDTNTSIVHPPPAMYRSALYRSTQIRHKWTWMSHNVGTLVNPLYKQHTSFVNKLQ